MVAESDKDLAASPAQLRAVDAWAKGVRGAPRGLAATITAVQPRDEVLHRVVSKVLRRQLSEQRTPARARRASSPRTPLGQVDPFVHTLQTLQDATLHVARCAACSGTCVESCRACAGRRVVACPGCSGAGKFRNPRTNRLNKCKPCKGSGSVACHNCASSGSVSCHVCQGSGHQNVWLTFVEHSRAQVALVPRDTPAADAHPQLLEGRGLSPAEIEAFILEFETHADGALELDELALAARGVIQQELSGLNVSTERVVWQQYTRLGIPRCDVTYEMCGGRGTLCLSGNDLTAATTDAALRPIRRRLMVWPVLVILGVISGGILAGSAMGRAPYFESTNDVVMLLWLGATIASIPWFGGLLRAWRPVLRVRGLRRVESGLGAIWLALVLCIPLVGALRKPTASAVEEALTEDNLARARVVVDGLIEREGEAASDLEDAVLLAEAEASVGRERLAKLDTIAAHGGPHAAKAAALARDDRLANIRELLQQDAPRRALVALVRDFAGNWREDPELAEEWARAEELLLRECTDDMCRFVALRGARQASETPQRVAAVEQVHAKLLASLSIAASEQAPGPVEQLHRCDELTAVASGIRRAQLGDEPLSVAADAATVWAAEQRATVAILGADVDTLRALFPASELEAENLVAVSLEGAELFFTLDAKGQCRGLYAVGPRGHRQLDATQWSADQILSQSFGRPMTVVPRAHATDVTSTWKHEKIKIVARWSGAVPAELRVGAAKP